MYTNSQLENLEKFYSDTLYDNVLPFWLNHGVDKQQGGIMTCLDREGNVFDTDKGVWQQGRFAWLMGYLYNNRYILFDDISKKSDWELWKEQCSQTCKFMKEHAIDADRRMFFQLTRDGRPIRKRRYTYSESFAAIAFGEAYRITSDTEYMHLALMCYSIFSCCAPYPPKFTAERPMISMGYHAILIATIQQLRRSIWLPHADKEIDKSIELIRTHFMKPDLQCVMESVAPNGDIIDSCEGRTLNPGHAIEGAWFIMKEGQYRNRQDYIQIGLDILDWMWARGWDNEYGGLFYFRDVYDKPCVEYWHDMKFWWNHCETIIATLLAYQLTGDEKYAKMHQQIHDWSFSHFADNEFGDWYGYLHRDGTISTTQKGNIFKGCFHLPRMLLECSQICKKITRKME